MSDADSAGLVIVPLVAITDAMIIECNVPEDDYPAHSMLTTYSKGGRVIVAAQHKVYESQIDSNTGKDPTLKANANAWLLVGYTNRWRGLTTASLAAKTSKVGGFSYRLRPQQVVTTLLIENAQCDSVRVRMVDPSEGVVYDTDTVQMSGLLRKSSMHAWYFGRRRRRTQLLLQDLPAYYGADIIVDVVATGEASVGLITFGYGQELGYGVKLGATVGITDYSKDVVNEFGDPVFTKLSYSDRATFELVLENTEVDEVKEALAELRATPALYIGSELYRCTVVLGRYSDFEVLISYNAESDCSINLKGMPRS